LFMAMGDVNDNPATLGGAHETSVSVP
jgi:hypothetical protein